MASAPKKAPTRKRGKAKPSAKAVVARKRDWDPGGTKKGAAEQPADGLERAGFGDALASVPDVSLTPIFVTIGIGLAISVMLRTRRSRRSRSRSLTRNRRKR